MHAYKRLGFDITLFLVTVVLVLIGIIMVFSSSGFIATTTHRAMTYFLVQQILGAVVGFALIIMLLSIKTRFYVHPYFVYGLMAVTGLLLLLCMMMPSVAHTQRWLQLAGLRFQPSELAKFSLILFLAFYCEK